MLNVEEAGVNDKSDAVPAERPDSAAMTDRQLAQAVLARTLRPRMGEVRRLAEAVLAKEGKKGSKNQKSSKLAKIPGQKKKKKDKS